MKVLGVGVALGTCPRPGIPRLEGLRNASQFPHKILCMEKVVRIFQSFEKADEADLRDRLAMTPEERVEVFLGIQQRTFRNAADERLARVYRVLTLEQS